MVKKIFLRRNALSKSGEKSITKLSRDEKNTVLGLQLLAWIFIFLVWLYSPIKLINKLIMQILEDFRVEFSPNMKVVVHKEMFLSEFGKH